MFQVKIFWMKYYVREYLKEILKSIGLFEFFKVERYITRIRYVWNKSNC